jgi:hypothetical protein
MTDDEALKRGAEAGHALGLALKDIISPKQLQIALMAAMAAIALVLESTSAEACHRFHIWRYPTPQRCAIRTHPVAETVRAGVDRPVAHSSQASGESRPDRHGPSPAREAGGMEPDKAGGIEDKNWFVEIVVPPDLGDDSERARALDQLKGKLK